MESNCSNEVKQLNERIQALRKVLEFYSDVENLLVMNNLWYEFGDRNIHLTQYLPFGSKAAAALVKDNEKEGVL
jgi:hypothetical protein